jgi:hypothetical protein
LREDLEKASVQLVVAEADLAKARDEYSALDKKAEEYACDAVAKDFLARPPDPTDPPPYCAY